MANDGLAGKFGGILDRGAGGVDCQALPWRHPVPAQSGTGLSS
jgi:hypothetical protein